MGIMIKRFFNHLRQNGIKATIFKIEKWLRIFLRKELILFKKSTRKDVFDEIYKRNHWSSEESASGQGSEIFQTENIRKNFPQVIKHYKCETVLDAPCGDFNWMKRIVKGNSFRYIGGDIVGSLIEKNKMLYANDRVSFIQLDICVDPLPDVDIMFCRDCLFHLSYSDIQDFINNFRRSKIPLLLVTTHKNPNHYFENKDIRSGDFRLIDLFAPPFNFPSEVLLRFDDYNDQMTPREMCLFRREQLESITL